MRNAYDEFIANVLSFSLGIAYGCTGFPNGQGYENTIQLQSRINCSRASQISAVASVLFDGTNHHNDPGRELCSWHVHRRRV